MNPIEPHLKSEWPLMNGPLSRSRSHIDNLHFIIASSIKRFGHPVTLLKMLYESEGISSRVGHFTPSKDLPHCYTIRPLWIIAKNSSISYCVSETCLATLVYEYMRLFHLLAWSKDSFAYFALEKLGYHTTSLFSEKWPSARLSGAIHLTGSLTVSSLLPCLK